MSTWSTPRPVLVQQMTNISAPQQQQAQVHHQQQVENITSMPADVWRHSLVLENFDPSANVIPVVSKSLFTI